MRLYVLMTACYRVPLQSLEQNEICSHIVHHNLNNSLFSAADITPVIKKDEKCLKNNYTPVSILPSVSKTYERCMYDQINEYFHPLHSKLLCGFPKGFCKQYYLLVLVKK